MTGQATPSAEIFKPMLIGIDFRKFGVERNKTGTPIVALYI